MRLLFFRICAIFIWNKEKRKNFKKKYIKPYKMISISKEEYTKLKFLQNELERMKNHSFVDYSNIQRIITAAITNNKAFSNFKGYYKGKTVVLMGAGPTVNNFTPIKNAIYVGCNRAFLYKQIDFDVLFAIDKVGIDNYYEEFFNYRKNNCFKFIGDQNCGKNYQIPENLIPLDEKTFKYITNAGCHGLPWEYPLDISTSPLINPPTVSLQAMQFILWTQPARIFIVGIDCTCASAKHFIGADTDCSFRNENVKNNDIVSIEFYKKIKEFVKTYYPFTEIISVNPIGLKGIFSDVYTASYLKDHPEIASENPEILKE